MEFVKDEGIVLRKSLAGDYDLSITVYFRKYGKENIYIPKGQLLKSPFLHTTEPFSWFYGVYFKRKEKFFIKELDRSKSLGLEIAKDINKLKTGFEILNIFNKYVIFPDEKVFILLKKSLYYLTTDINIDLFRLNFLAKLIYLSGIYPELNQCVRCSTKINKYNYGFLSTNEGGVVCKKCTKKRDNLTYQDIVTLKLLKDIRFQSLNKLKLVSTPKLENFLKDYLSKNL